MRPDQKKHLRDRVSAVFRRAERQSWLRSEIENAPEEIQQAAREKERLEEKIGEWVESVELEQREIRNRLKARKREIMETVLFKEPEEALAEVKKLEEEYPE